MAVWNQELRYYISLAITAQPSRKRDLPRFQPNCLDAHIQQRAYPILLRPPIVQTMYRWYRNINLLSIAYAFQPRLRSRLTLSGRAFLRKPWAFDGGDSHPSFRYSYRHSHFQALHHFSRSSFAAAWNAPLPCHRIHSSFHTHRFAMAFSRKHRIEPERCFRRMSFADDQ